MNRLSREKRVLIYKLLTRGSGGVNATAELAECSPTTLRKFVIEYGLAAYALHSHVIRNISSQRVQIDEVWSYIYAKQENLGQCVAAPPDAGDVWTWTALCADSRVLITFLVGGRDAETAERFLRDLQARLAIRPQITTDGLRLYPNVIDLVFGKDVDYGVVRKALGKDEFDPVRRLSKVTVLQMHKDALIGNPLEEHMSTSLGERQHATMRNYTRRMTRATYGFSKSFLHHARSQALYAVYYNLIKPHRSLGTSPQRKYGNWTPAMAAGLTDRPWTHEDFIEWAEQFFEVQPTVAAPKPEPPAWVPLQQGETRETAPYFVIHDPIKHRTKVHAGHCRNCQWGLGRADGTARFNRVYSFEDIDLARACAIDLEPHQASDCAICIKGHYRTRTQPVKKQGWET